MSQTADTTNFLIPKRHPASSGIPKLNCFRAVQAYGLLIANFFSSLTFTHWIASLSLAMMTAITRQPRSFSTHTLNCLRLTRISHLQPGVCVKQTAKRFVANSQAQREALSHSLLTRLKGCPQGRFASIHLAVPPPPPPIDHSTLSYYTTKTYSCNSYKFPFKTSIDYPPPDFVISRNGDRIPRNKTHILAFLHINFRKKRGCFYALRGYSCKC
jgi:hypothetical protein